MVVNKARNGYARALVSAHIGCAWRVAGTHAGIPIRPRDFDPTYSVRFVRFVHRERCLPPRISLLCGCALLPWMGIDSFDELSIVLSVASLH